MSEIEIEIPRWTIYSTLLVIVLVVFGAIGNTVSPRDSENRPVLLMPDVRAVEQYRAATALWVSEWVALDKQLRSIMEAPLGNDLLGQSRKAQQAVDQALDLSRTIEANDSPSSLIGLSAQARNAAGAYLNASMAVARFVSAPTPDNKIEAASSVMIAGRTLGDLQANEWMLERKPVLTHLPALTPTPTRTNLKDKDK